MFFSYSNYFPTCIINVVKCLWVLLLLLLVVSKKLTPISISMFTLNADSF